MKRIITCLAVATIIGITGCTRTQVGTAGGALVGAGIGQAVGGNTASTLIGAGAGALIGNAVSR